MIPETHITVVAGCAGSRRCLASVAFTPRGGRRDCAQIRQGRFPAHPVSRCTASSSSSSQLKLANCKLVAVAQAISSLVQLFAFSAVYATLVHVAEFQLVRWQNTIHSTEDP